MLPLSVVRPLVVTVKYLSAVVVPTGPKVTAPEPALIVRPCVLAVAALTACEPKLTTPLPVDVVMVTSLPSFMPPVPTLKLTPAAVPVVILPLSVVRPLAVTVKDESALVVPIAPSVTAPEPEVRVRP